jgi:hypothetical protein
MTTLQSERAEFYSAMQDALAAGQTVTISTVYRATIVTPKAYAKWQASGQALFRYSADGSSAYIARGKSWDCIDYCAIHIAGGK